MQPNKRSTSVSVRNTVGRKCPSVHKKLLLQKNWYVVTGQRVMHDGMQYNLIESQGNDPFEVGKSAIFKGYLIRHL